MKGKNSMSTFMAMIPETRDLPEGREDAMLADLLASLDSEPEQNSTPSRRLPWRRYSLLASAAAAGAAVMVLATNVLGADPAYASWTAKPASADAHLVRTLGAQCISRVRDAFPSAPRGLKPVTSERRGDYTTMLVATGGTVSLCADWVGAASKDQARGGTLEGMTTGARLDEGVSVLTLGVPGQVNGSDAVRFAYGMTAPNIKSVVVTTSKGVDVTATVADGYFVAWWPSGAEIARIGAVDRAGNPVSPSAIQGPR